MKSDIISKYKALVDSGLKSELSYNESLYQSVIDAMNYSVSIGGKRIRPCILMEFANICGGDTDKSSALYSKGSAPDRAGGSQL